MPIMFRIKLIQVLFVICANAIGVCYAGQLCAWCSDIDKLRTCTRYTTCDDTEECYQRQYTNGSGTTLYELGCISSQACQYTPAMIGKRGAAAGSHFKCFTCCNNTALCNHRLDCGTVTQTTQNVCASCNNLSRPNDCLRQESCAKGESCYVYKYRTNSGSVFYDLGCTSESACPPTSSPITHVKRSEAHHFTCLACCKNANSCNKNLTCDKTSVKPTATTNQATLTIPAILPRDCGELKLTHGRNGPYSIFPYSVSNISISVYCEFDSDGTWTVIQRRFNGSVDFYRNWTEYKRGFGSSNGEYWLGNDNIHQLTSLGNYSLKIALTDWKNHSFYAEYSTFFVANETDNYRLTIGGFSGNTRDNMADHNRGMFSTKDRNNKNGRVEVCGKGAWWHYSCCSSSLNGVFSKNYVMLKSGMYWFISQDNEAMKTSEMMIRKI